LYRFTSVFAPCEQLPPTRPGETLRILPRQIAQSRGAWVTAGRPGPARSIVVVFLVLFYGFRSGGPRRRSCEKRATLDLAEEDQHAQQSQVFHRDLLFIVDGSSGSLEGGVSSVCCRLHANERWRHLVNMERLAL
jgi:hypothetical protein